jgi:hypothetical protein
MVIMNAQQLEIAARYKDAERLPRHAVARVWSESRQALAFFAVLKQRLESGDLQEAAQAHAENIAPFGGAIDAIRSQAAQLVATIEAVQAAGRAAGLDPFPGVVVDESE